VTAIACGLSGMDKAEISDIRRALTPALPSLPAAVAAAVAAYLEKRSA
jgi:hypothetical protein